MNDVTLILSAIEQGDPSASGQLLPLVCEESRRLAAQNLAREKPGQTLRATALVHEAYPRLVNADHLQGWDGCGHFFVAAAEALRILVENARRKRRLKHSGGRARVPLDRDHVAARESDNNPDGLLAFSEALRKLAVVDARAAELVKRRYSAGLTIPQATVGDRLAGAISRE